MEFPKNFEPGSMEARWQADWADSRIYAWDPSRGRDETFVVDTPPPTVSGSLHVGHLFSYSHQDFIVRYQRMRGKNIFFPIGWDDNGLPTERRVQNMYNVKCDAHLHYKPDFQRERGRLHKTAYRNKHFPIGLRPFLQNIILPICDGEPTTRHKRFRQFPNHHRIPVFDFRVDAP